ncbi:MAG TPA: hypothetical protein VL588_12960, partial [Bdellovibrionota bacterium]|nr:hypothetical protein [Bdellovibrionota bacterium]
MARLGFRGPFRAAVIFCLCASLGCGLGKREDAFDALTASFAHHLEPGSDLTRNSNAATYLRLATLFPAATQPVGAKPAFMSPENMNQLYSGGLTRALTADGRPSSAVSQLALRQWVASLCKSWATTSTQGSIFSTTGILMSGETLPSDPVAQMAFAAARNAWLAPIAADSGEVAILSDAYNQILAKDGAAAAKQGVCMAALLAPQFWVGTGGPVDPLRRAALEVGRHVLTFAEIEDFLAGKFTLADYVQRLQTDSQYQGGYLQATHEWHRSWWGLRDFMKVRAGTTFTDDSYQWVFQDPRGAVYSNGQGGFGHLQSGVSYVTHMMADGNPQISVGGFYAAYYHNWDYTTDCVAENNGQPNIQTFDPRTTLITFEHRLPGTTDTWEIIGGYVLNTTDAISQYTALVNATGGAFDFKTQCKLHSEKYPPGAATYNTYIGYNAYTDGQLNRDVAGYPRYFECGGLASIPNSITKKPTEMWDFRPDGIPNPNDTKVRTAMYAAQWSLTPVRPESTPRPNNLIGTVHETWGAGDRRIRRYGGDGKPQNGVSAVDQWYTGSKAYACNSFQRYLLSCVFRGKSSITWENASDFPNWFGAGSPWMHDGAFFSVATMSNPMFLNQFRCGVPDTTKMQDKGDLKSIAATNATNDEQIYPHGYAFTEAGYTGSLGTLNTRMLRAPFHYGQHYMGGMPPQAQLNAYPETQAMNRLTRDLNNEPYYLLDHVLTHDLPYGEMFTANYTFGHDESELFYRIQGLQLPAYPGGAEPSSFAEQPLRQYSRDGFQGIPLAWFLDTNGAVNGQSAMSDFAKTNGYYPPQRTAGILTMPAFIGPVSQKMRTIASRVFTRLLCGSPNMYVPSGAAEDLHVRFMSDPANPAPAEHFNKRSSCYACHVNLDPLAAGLAAHFLK